MITEEQFKKASEDKKAAEELISKYFNQKREIADARYKEFQQGKAYSDEELFYSRTSLCPCGHGLAYVKGSGSQSFWDCSAIWKGIADVNIKHTDQLPFAFYNVKGEQEINGNMHSTRGVFKPQVL